MVVVVVSTAFARPIHWGVSFLALHTLFHLYIPIRMRLKHVQTAIRTEMERATLEFDRRGCCLSLNRHSADFVMYLHLTLLG
jgi:hypothetical protein